MNFSLSFKKIRKGVRTLGRADCEKRGKDGITRKYGEKQNTDIWENKEPKVTKTQISKVKKI